MSAVEIAQKLGTESQLDGSLKPKHVLVVGADPGVQGVVAVPWQKFPDINIKDFHLVILCPEAGRSDGASMQDFKKYQVSSGVVKEFMGGRNRELVFVGPALPHGWPIPVYEELRYIPRPRREAGSNITDVGEEFGAYLELVEKYAWTLPQGITDRQKFPRTSTKPLARAAATDVIAAIFKNSSHPRVVILPEPTRCSLDEGVAVLLRTHFGIGISPSPRPDWLDRISTPRVDQSRALVGDRKTAMREAIDAMRDAQAQLSAAESDLKIIYEQGPILEQEVRRILSDLGAEVSDPENHHAGSDGTLVSPSGRKAVLEIKGRSKSIALSDVRQLDQWVTDLTYEGGDDGQEEWKGVFLANAFIHVHPDDREPPFPANAIDYAEKRELALLTTSDLLNALVADQTGEHDPQAWWDDVIATSGLFGEPEAGSY